MFGHRFYAPHFGQQQQRHCQQQEPNFQGLFRLIDDWDRYAQQAGASNTNSSTRRPIQSFAPKFDVRETETSYELTGELPGVEKENVHIEFTDPQTVQIRGRVERSFQAQSDLASAVPNLLQHDGDEEAVMVDAPEQPHEHDDETRSETGSNKSFQATVEDDVDAEAASITSSTAAAVPTPATTTVEPAKKSEVQKQQQPEQPAKPQPKFLVSERSVGEFNRQFSFPARVEAEGVSASLDRGILSVSVPKARKHVSHRIAVL